MKNESYKSRNEQFNKTETLNATPNHIARRLGVAALTATLAFTGIAAYDTFGPKIEVASETGSINQGEGVQVVVERIAEELQVEDHLVFKPIEVGDAVSTASGEAYDSNGNVQPGVTIKVSAYESPIFGNIDLIGSVVKK